MDRTFTEESAAKYNEEIDELTDEIIAAATHNKPLDHRAQRCMSDRHITARKPSLEEHDRMDR